MNYAKLSILGIAVLMVSCNVTSGSHVTIGNQHPPLTPEQVLIYTRPPVKFEEVGIVNASSKNAFASDQSLTDSTIVRMKKEAAKMGANGILLKGFGNQQIGSFTSGMVNANTYGNVSATGYGYGNMTNIYGTGNFNTAATGSSFTTPIVAKVSSGIAIYVIRP